MNGGVWPRSLGFGFKIKCSQGLPCKRCATSGASCEYPAYVKRTEVPASTVRNLPDQSACRRAKKRQPDTVRYDVVQPEHDEAHTAQHRNVLLLESLLRDTERAYSVLTGASLKERSLDILTGNKPAFLLAAPAIVASASAQTPSNAREGGMEADLESSELEQMIENPLAMLAHVAKGSLRRADTEMVDVQGTGSFLPTTYDDVRPPDKYFSTGT